MRSMVVYGSFLDATKDMSPKAFKEFWIAILEYGIDLKEPGEMSKPAQMAYSLAKPNVDVNLKRRKKDPCEQLPTIANNCEQLMTPSNDGDVDIFANANIDGDVDTKVDVDGEGESEGEQTRPRRRARSSSRKIDWSKV